MSETISESNGTSRLSNSELVNASDDGIGVDDETRTDICSGGSW